MFFPQLITGIMPTDRVLEVGPGANPHPRADEMLELRYANEDERTHQVGNARPLITSKKVTYYDGGAFPYADGSFDYVICAHVLEHVQDIESFMFEVFRVGRRGYFEYPLAYYDLLYNIAAHVNLLKYVDGRMRYLRKSDTHMEEFKALQSLLAQTMNEGHTKLIDEMPDLFMEGLEREQPFPAERVFDVKAVAHSGYRIPARSETSLDYYGGRKLLRHLVKVALRRLSLIKG